ncbi:class I SAM-dependent methyltransferase [Polynucleobacter acidiphobus]|uniref:class I SAM-dependent methyltransferase n=1 Tax=Polynucleobacter acidiphobus TaxID=556053 RepID=UPI000D379416|nr:class I SAM-dependent methyltransferase [Polynucleobacter acidiphobus]
MSKVNIHIQKNTPQFIKYYEDPKSKLIELIREYKFKSAIEIGCGGGSNLSELKKINPNCFTVGIELRPDLQEKLKRNDSVNEFYIGDVFELLPILDRSFDVIILSHVLEHFSDPENLLNACKKLATKNTIFLIALPNIRHISVLAPLIFSDQFEYKSAGILDITHLRFFTRKTAEILIESCGLHIMNCNPEISNRKSGFVNRMTLGLMSGFCAHAYNFICKMKV